MTTNPASRSQTTPKRAPKMAANQSLNHLLNFTLPPRQTQNVQSLPRRSRKTGTQQGVWNKERFVNAQYRFVMNPNGDYTVHFADPDIFFQWHDILQVIIPRSSALASTTTSYEEGHTTCPICLSPPTAPRMTKCGHVFCFPCILHYLNTSDNLKWVRCPICFDSVNEKQLKSVKWFDGPGNADDDLDSAPPESSSSSAQFEPTPREGTVMRMRLMQRPQITTLALPRSGTWPSDLIPPHKAPFHFLPDVFAYAKFMLATPAYLINDLTHDLDALAEERRSLAGMGDELSLTFIDSAEEKLRLQIAKAGALDSTILNDAIEKAVRDQQEIEERSAHQDRRVQAAEVVVQAANDEPIEVPEAFLATQPMGFSTPVRVPVSSPSPSPTPNRNPRQRRNLNPPPPSTSTYYYYQASSGFPIFLHPLDIKILFSHFNGYASFPDEIIVRVEAATEGSVNDDLRRRCKYLAHMPEGADVVFVEAGLEGVVDAEGLKAFEGALKGRRARRKEKGRKDDRARARAEEREKAGRHGWAAEAGHVVPLPSAERVGTPVEEIVPEQEHAAPVPEVAGAWGTRSFASALHSSASPRGRNGGVPRSIAHDDADEWDMDLAWHELEQRNANGNGGRKKRNNNRLVVLGGGPVRRR